MKKSDEFTIGGYIPIDSVLRRLDPRVKLLNFGLLLLAIFGSKSWPALLLPASATMAFLILSAIPFATWFRFLRRFVVMFVIVFVSNALFVQYGEIIYVNSTALPLTYQGVIRGAFLSGQLGLMILLSLLLTATGNPRDLARAFEWFISPLKRLGVRTQEIGTILLLALRFLPVLSSEVRSTADAQRARGIDLRAGGIAARAGAGLALLVPAVRNALRRADLLTEAMAGRGFVPGKPRTEFIKLTFGYNDLVAFICCALAPIGVFFAG